jgi:hypothetical protein
MSALALCAAVAGCGEGAAESPLDEGLGYLPRDSRIVVAVSTDIRSAQGRRVAELLDRFPPARRTLDRLLAGLERAGLDPVRELQPLLGNDLVIGVLDTTDFRAFGAENQVLALETHDEEGLRSVVEKLVRPGVLRAAGDVRGADLYTTRDGSAVAVRDKVVVVASTRESLQAALLQRDRSDRLTEDDFESALGDLDPNAPLRMTADVRRSLEPRVDARVRSALPWFEALGRAAAAATLSGDSLRLDLRVTSEPRRLSDALLPLAPGASSPRLLSGGERTASVAINDLSRLLAFRERLVEVIDPDAAARERRVRTELSAALGTDIDSLLLDQLTGRTALSFGRGGSLRARAELADPDGFGVLLAGVADRLPRAAEALGVEGASVAQVPGAPGLIRVSAGAGSLMLGVADGELVVAPDAATARATARDQGRRLVGARGSIVASGDGATLARALLRRREPAFDRLGEVTGWVETSLSGIRARIELQGRGP